MAQAATLGLGHDALLPRQPGGNGAGVLLSVLVHGALVLALTTAVDWHSEASDVVSAELWSVVPQVAGAAATQAQTPPQPQAQPETAAPPAAVTPVAAPPPPPSPAPARGAEPAQPEPDIALERATRRQAELEKQDAARKARLAEQQAQAKAQAQERAQAQAKEQAKEQAKAQADADRKQRAQAAQAAKQEDQRLAKLREQALARMMGEAGKAGGDNGSGDIKGSGSQALNSSVSAAYSARLAALIKRNSRFAGNLPDNNGTEVQVFAAPSGSIISRRITKTSGHPEWDDAVLRAIDRTGRLPPDERGIVPSPLTISFKPNDG